MGATSPSRMKSVTWDVDRLAQASGLSRLKIEELFLDYMKASGRDGVMNMQEFIQLYSNLPVSRSQPRTRIRNQAIRIFHTFDRNHTGTLEFDEFLNAFVMINHHMSETDPIELLIQENNGLFCEKRDERICKQYGLQIFQRINRYHGLLPGMEYRCWTEVDRYDRGYVTHGELVEYVTRQTIYNR
jgi:Ca2+-binding EF-hand superfamily protein